MWLCVAVVRGGRAWRSCVAVVRGGRAWSCVVVRGRARSCAVVRGPSCVAVRGCVVVRGHHSLPFCPLRGQHCRDARTDGHTTYNTPINPPGVGWVNFFYPIKVRVSIRTCVPNFGSIRGSVRKNCLLSLIIDIQVNVKRSMRGVHC